jgi:hypothetical protein
MEPNIEKNLNKDPRHFDPLAPEHKEYGSAKHNQVPSSERSHDWKFAFENLSNDMIRLWDKESRLIRTEMNEKVSQVKTAAGALAAGGSVMLVGVFSLAATAIIALDLVMPLWLSAVIVTAALFIVGGIMLATGKKKLEAEKLKPRHSIETLGEIKTTLQERVHEFTKH